MTLDEAIQTLRSDPAHADLVRDAFLGADVADSARRFTTSKEFAAVKAIASRWINGGVVVDLGSGVGIACCAFAQGGAKKIIGVEPDISNEVGRGAAERLTAGLPVEHVAAFGESMPIPDASVDLVYTRQVLHHTTDLNRTLRECARVLKPGGAFLACREHVVDDNDELERFLARHAVHQLAGGENAYKLEEYESAIRNAPLQLKQTLGFYDSVINSFPTVKTDEELSALPATVLRRRFGSAAKLLAKLPGVDAAIRRRHEKQIPGRMYSFFAVKP